MRTFTERPLPAVQAQQKEAVQQSGFLARAWKFSKDAVNSFGKKAGAYLGEALPVALGAAAVAGVTKMLKNPKGLVNNMKGLVPSGLPSFSSNPAASASQTESLGATDSEVPQSAPSTRNVKVKGEGHSSRFALTASRAMEKAEPTGLERRVLPAARGGRRYTGFADEGKLSVENGIPKSRSDLPTTREGYMALATQLTGMGHPMRVNKNSALKNIRLNFIRKLKLA
jgi:hypothetical protein